MVKGGGIRKPLFAKNDRGSTIFRQGVRFIKGWWTTKPPPYQGQKQESLKTKGKGSQQAREFRWRKHTPKKTGDGRWGILSDDGAVGGPY